MTSQRVSFFSHPWFWIVLGGGGLLVLVGMMPAESEPPKASSPTPPPNMSEQVQDNMRLLKEWALKSGGDFNKVPPEVQSYVNQMSMGHGKEMLRMEWEKSQKTKIPNKTTEKGSRSHKASTNE
jgi:hypothetical protein